MKNQTSTKAISIQGCCSRRQKIWGLIAVVGLFICGMMIGMTFKGNGMNAGDVAAMTRDDCRNLQNQISNMALNARDVDPDVFQSYNDLFAQNCARYASQPNKPHHDNTTSDTSNASDMATCAIIEEMLLQELYPESSNADERIVRAKTYAVLSERGCPENSKKYADMAARELAIARAINDDHFDADETQEVVETYKRLEMKAAAQDVLNKVQKITEPAIDFILKMEKIINE